MFSNQARQEIEAQVLVVADSGEDGRRFAERLHEVSGSSESVRADGSFDYVAGRFLGQAIRLVVQVAPSDALDLRTTDMVLLGVASERLGATLLRVRAAIGVAGRKPASVCVLVPGPTHEAADDAWEVVSSEGELGRQLVAQVLRGIEERRLEHETRLSDPFTRDALLQSARLAVFGHLQAHWGEARAEYNMAKLSGGRPYFCVLECAPASGRPFWSYATFGLSLQAQVGGGDSAHLELVAYAPQSDQRVADVLFAAASIVVTAEPGERSLQPFDTLELTGMKLFHEFFALAPAPEEPAFHAFPAEGDLFSLAVTGKESCRCRVAFLQLVPLTEAQCEFARADGSKQLLAKLDRTGGKRADGWPSLARRSRWKFWQ